MPQDVFKIEREVLAAQRVAILKISGNIDAHTYDQVEETVAETFQEKCFKLVIDMGHVDYISSAGTGVFIGALSEAQNNNGNVALLNLSPTVLQVFDLLGLTPLFLVFTNRAEAIKAVS